MGCRMSSPLLTINSPLTAFPLLSSQNMTVAKMSVYKRMKLACFDCGRSEHDCACMSCSVHSNVDSFQQAYALSPLSVNDCAATLRSCKSSASCWSAHTHTHTALLLSVCWMASACLCETVACVSRIASNQNCWWGWTSDSVDCFSLERFCSVRYSAFGLVLLGFLLHAVFVCNVAV